MQRSLLLPHPNEDDAGKKIFLSWTTYIISKDTYDIWDKESRLSNKKTKTKTPHLTKRQRQRHHTQVLFDKEQS